MNECLIAASYYAPRGGKRLLELGNQISMRYLRPEDSLIGIIGEKGVGKSLLIKGMFPGLELTSNDSGVTVRPLPLAELEEDSYYSAQTYHLDMRFETAFKQVGELVRLIKKALEMGKRIVIEHFELVYSMLEINAALLVGVGEEIIITRPTVLGPFPDEIYNAIEGTAKYRKMAHSAEDLTGFILKREYNYGVPSIHSDFPRGFVIEFSKKPHFDLQEVEARVKEEIRKGLDISRVGDTAIRFGDQEFPCTGTRIHVKNSRDIEGFRLIKRLFRDPLTKQYKLVGLVGKEMREYYNYMLPLDPKHFKE